MVMQHVIGCVVKPALGLFKVLMGLFAERYFCHLFYIAKIQYCTRLVMAKIKTLRYDYKEENEHLEVVPIGKQMKNILQNSSWDVN